MLAVLAAGVWFSNIHSLFQPKDTPKYTDFDALTTPTPRKSAEEILGITPTPQGQRKYADFESFMQQRRQQQGQPGPRLSAVEIFEREQAAPQGQTAEERRRIWRQEQKRAAAERLGATAICRDGTYSYSANRRGTCSHHGGVAQWLSR